MASHAERVLSAVLNSANPRRDLLGKMQLALQPEHFTNEIHKNLFRLLGRYYDRTGEVMSQDVFEQALTDAGVDASKVLNYTSAYAALASMAVSEADFKWSVEELQHEQAKRLTGVAITESMEILERGYQIGKDFLQGHEDARSFLGKRLAEIDHIDGNEIPPEGNVFIEVKDIWTEYQERKAQREAGVTTGILTGVPLIDGRTDGYQDGELILVCGYANDGKSMLATQTGWWASVMQGENVFFATSETLRPQVTRRFIARHSMLPQFDHPINSADIKKGTLTAADEKVLKDVLEDWHYNSDYGQFNVVQLPNHATLGYVENRLKAYERETEVGLCVIDYLALLTADIKRNNEREEFNQIIRGSKGIAHGHEIPVVSPWQVTRTAYEEALRRGYYNKASLSDTSEAEKSPDVIITMLREEGNTTSSSLQFLKVRDDAFPPITSVAIDLRYTYFGAHNENVNFNPANQSSDLTSFL